MVSGSKPDVAYFALGMALKGLTGEFVLLCVVCVILLGYVIALHVGMLFLHSAGHHFKLPPAWLAQLVRASDC